MAEQAANATTTEARDAKGRFRPGNAGGPGNPFARQVAALRQAVVDNVTPDDIQIIIKAMIARAAEGHVPAAKLLLTYCVGKPQPAPEPDRMDAHEWDLYKETAPMAGEAAALIQAGTPQSHLQMVRTMQPLVTQLMRGELLKTATETPEQRIAREDAHAAEAERIMNSPGPDWPVPSPISETEEAAPSANGKNGEAPSPNGNRRETPPLANGHHGEPAPSRNGYYRDIPPSANGDRTPFHMG